MSLCDICKGRSERPCSYAARTREYYDALITALRYRAYRCGYALAVHGSLKTDIDLIAVPWRDSAVGQEFLAEEIRALAEQIVGTARVRQGDPNPTKKPCGRLAWSFYLVPDGMEGPYIDLSVMPVLDTQHVEQMQTALRRCIGIFQLLANDGKYPEPLLGQGWQFAIDAIEGRDAG